MSQASLLDDFDPAEVAAAIAGRARDLAVMGTSRSIRTSSNVRTRRVESDEVLADLVPAQVEPGDSWHILSSGDIDVLSILRNLLAGASHFDFVLMTTWRINRDDLEQIDAWLDAGLIDEWHLVIDQRFSRLAPDEFTLAKRMGDDYGGSVTTCLNHSKVMLCANEATGT